MLGTPDCSRELPRTFVGRLENLSVCAADLSYRIAWFSRVTREEAEAVLRRSHSYGAISARPILGAFSRGPYSVPVRTLRPLHAGQGPLSSYITLLNRRKMMTEHNLELRIAPIYNGDGPEDAYCMVHRRFAVASGFSGPEFAIHARVFSALPHIEDPMLRTVLFRLLFEFASTPTERVVEGGWRCIFNDAQTAAADYGACIVSRNGFSLLHPTVAAGEKICLINTVHVKKTLEAKFGSNMTTSCATEDETVHAQLDVALTEFMALLSRNEHIILQTMCALFQHGKTQFDTMIIAQHTGSVGIEVEAVRIGFMRLARFLPKIGLRLLNAPGIWIKDKSGYVVLAASDKEDTKALARIMAAISTFYEGAQAELPPETAAEMEDALVPPEKAAAALVRVRNIDDFHSTLRHYLGAHPDARRISPLLGELAKIDLEQCSGFFGRQRARFMACLRELIVKRDDGGGISETQLNALIMWEA